jgi:hypothetical protein
MGEILNGHSKRDGSELNVLNGAVCWFHAQDISALLRVKFGRAAMGRDEIHDDRCAAECGLSQVGRVCSPTVRWLSSAAAFDGRLTPAYGNKWEVGSR